MVSPFSLTDEVALVTGGASGIGQAISVALAQAGAAVAISTHERPATDSMSMINACGRRSLSVRADLETLDSRGARALFDEVEAELGAVTILVNNAGIIRRAPAADYPDEDWRAVLDVNLNAPWLLSREAGKRMLGRGRGKIIGVASLLSFQGGVTVPAYSASKHALAGLTKALANEWGAHGINVNAIAPGYIATSNTQALREDATRNRQILERIPAGRWGSPEDIAGAAVFLASRAADYINGQILAVDGGWLAR